MNPLSKTTLNSLCEQYGPLYGCTMECAAFVISEDLGDLVLGDDRYDGYVIYYGTSFGPHMYCMVDPNAEGGDALRRVVQGGHLPRDYLEVDWGSAQDHWTPAHPRLVNRLRRVVWSSFVGGEAALPELGSPLSDYPGDGGNWVDEMLRPNAETDEKSRTAEEQLYLDDPTAWHTHVGFPCAAADWNLASREWEATGVACFVTALETGRSWSMHKGPIDKISHLFEDPTKDQHLGSQSDAMEVFDEFEPNELAGRCVLTRYPSTQIQLRFAGGRFLTFHKLSQTGPSHSGGVDAQAPPGSKYGTTPYRLTDEEDRELGQTTYADIVEAIAGWPPATV